MEFQDIIYNEYFLVAASIIVIIVVYFAFNTESFALLSKSKIYNVDSEQLIVTSDQDDTEKTGDCEQLDKLDGFDGTPEIKKSYIDPPEIFVPSPFNAESSTMSDLHIS